jgi:hypothetical protein
LTEAPDALDVIPEHAVRYFGDRLHLVIKPNRLKRRISDWVSDQRGVRWTGISFLDAANWEGAISPVHHSPIHREMREIIGAGDGFRDTRAYRGFVRSIERGHPRKRNNIRLDSVETIEAYFHYCRDLIESARQHGIMRHSESGGFHRLRLKHLGARPALHDSAERDIGVAITEAGDLIRHLGGKHRTAIAQGLGLPTIPVEVRMVHIGWLARQVARTGLPPHQALIEGVRLIVEGGEGEPGIARKRDLGANELSRRARRGRKLRSRPS